MSKSSWRASVGSNASVERGSPPGSSRLSPTCSGDRVRCLKAEPQWGGLDPDPSSTVL